VNAGVVIGPLQYQKGGLRATRNVIVYSSESSTLIISESDGDTRTTIGVGSGI